MVARLAQSVEHETLNLRVVGSSPTLGVVFFLIPFPLTFCDNINLQLLTVTPIPGDDDYIMAEANGKSGKIPKSYIEFL